MRANEESVREGAGAPAFEVERVRRDFPILQRPVNGRSLVYLDTAASAQKPRAVLDEMTRFMSEDYANIHRGVYALSQRSTALYDAAREKVARFIHAGDAREIVFVRNATGGAPLHATVDGPLGAPQHDARVDRPLHHEGGYRRARHVSARDAIASGRPPDAPGNSRERRASSEPPNVSAERDPVEPPLDLALSISMRSIACSRGDLDGCPRAYQYPLHDRGVLAPLASDEADQHG
ncbi:MAG TPA: aminotransferase class V-fold PLP-dependent enzyme [Polyangiaceae bacterium]|nr:aminotransferase class V-fold PLP-dependent enzyme [Polyangiaceae bacterium]